MSLKRLDHGGSQRKSRAINEVFQSRGCGPVVEHEIKKQMKPSLKYGDVVHDHILIAIRDPCFSIEKSILSGLIKSNRLDLSHNDRMESALERACRTSTILLLHLAVPRGVVQRAEPVAILPRLAFFFHRHFVRCTSRTRTRNLTAPGGKTIPQKLVVYVE